jgi:putative FmdB family regulatory protein
LPVIGSDPKVEEGKHFSEVSVLPTYEYRCSQCSHQYEKREGFDSPPLQECPRCGSEARRLLHAPPILFKGQGFYVTDNRKPSPVGSPASEVESVTTAETKKEPAAEKPSGDGNRPSEKAATT